jgi:hypothetical protein
VKIIEKREHLSLGSVNSNRPLRAERVRLCGGQDEESYDCDQDRKQLSSKAYFFQRKLLCTATCGRCFGNCETWQFYFVGEPIGIGRFGVANNPQELNGHRSWAAVPPPVDSG